MSCTSCGGEDFYILTKHPAGLLVECIDCHYRWTIEEKEHDDN